MMKDSFEHRVTLFYMKRNVDESGVSGTGRVLEGAVFPSGHVVVCWNSENSSIAIHKSLEDFQKCHMDPHPGMNELIFINDENDKEIKTKRFCLFREFNPKFKSLTLGRIIEGVQFFNQKVVAEFTPPLQTLTVYDSIETFKNISVNPNKDTNNLVFLDF